MALPADRLFAGKCFLKTFTAGFERFRLKSNRKARVEFGLVALAHSQRK